jgi:hypothetical protein
MPDNFPPDATPEQKGCVRTFSVSRDQEIPLEITEVDVRNIARNARTYGG